MIHDFATVPRQADWRQAGRQDGRKSEARKPPARKAEGRKAEFTRVPPRQEPIAAAGKKNSRRAVLPVIAVCVLVFVAKIALSGGEPVSDQQPDAAAKKEYEESVLLSEAAVSPAEPLNAGLVESGDPETAVMQSVGSTEQQPQAASGSVAQVSESRVQITREVETVSVEAEKTATRIEASDIVQADVKVDPDYEFYDSLKQGSWPVPINKGAYVDGELSERERPVYKLQAASFRSKEDAYRLAGKLKSYKLAAVVVPSVSSNGQYWYQVSVGPFVSTTKLNKAQDVLVSMNMMPLKKRVQ